MLSLQKFADSLDAGVIVATHVDDDEVELEGSFWLALLTGAAFALEEDLMHSGLQCRAGWIVVPGPWYALRQKSERGHELLPNQVMQL